MRRIAAEPRGVSALGILLSYADVVSGAGSAAVRRVVEHELGTEIGDRAMSFKEMILQAGRREGYDVGLRDGRQEGREEGHRELLVNLLTWRFLEISAAIREQVEEADEERLLAWSRKVLEARTIEEVFEGS
jgi:hypothetical protein